MCKKPRLVRFALKSTTEASHVMRSLWNRPWESESREQSIDARVSLSSFTDEEISSRHTASTSASTLPDDVLMVEMQSIALLF